MRVLALALREIGHRKLNFTLGAIAAAIAVASVLIGSAMLKVYQLRSDQVLIRKEQELNETMRVLRDEMRKATLKLSFNLAILPGDQSIREWHEKDYATTYMPEDYVRRLAASNIVTVRHFLPMLQQKVEWPEMKRTIILIGCRGEVPNLHKDPRKPLVQPVPAGALVIGYDLHRSLGLEPGRKVKLMGREYTVHTCNPERGSKDDITVWIPLEDAQELFGKEKQINAILALKCLCLGHIPIDRMRAELSKILPETKVIEFGTRVLARAEARLRVQKESKAALERERRNQERLSAERENFGALLIPGLLAACAIWIALTAFINARGRSMEVAVLRALGYRARQILALFLSRSIIGGLLGGLAGCGAAILVGENLRGDLEVPLLGSTGLLSWQWLLIGLALAPVLGMIAGWFPALVTSQRDPAQILREE